MHAGDEIKAQPSAGRTDEELVRRSTERLHRLLDQDAELASALPSEEALEAIRSEATSIESVARAFELYSDRVALRERAYAIDDRGDVRLLPELRSIRYREVWARVEAFASGLVHEGLVEPGSFVGICGFASVDWAVADLACVYLAAVSVPLQTTSSAVDLQHIVNETELACIVCSVDQLELVCSVLPECPSVRSIVVMNLREGDRAREAEVSRHEAELDVAVYRMSQLEAHGNERGIVPKVLPAARGEQDPLMTLMYTSGSTGAPKGAMVPESLFCRQWQRGFFPRVGRPLEQIPEITVVYMPLNHAAGRGSLVRSIVRGGIVAFAAESDMSTLFEDIRLARPTHLLFVPRVADALYRHYHAEVARRSSGASSDEERERIAQSVMTEMGESFLGDRLLFGMLGTAPTPPEVVSFLKRCFRIPLEDSYGSTEAGPVSFDGFVVPGVSFKLVDVPELGYGATDEPYPRGELYVKSSLLVPGYYKSEEATRELFDEEGFLKMGDIVELRAPDRIVWVDRAKNVLKLAQGEFVATSHLEVLFTSRSRFLRQVYLYGNSHRAYLVAVVVPDLEAAAEELGPDPDDAALERLVRSELDRVAAEADLKPYENPRAFLLERSPFTVESGLLTASNKPARAKLRARYGEQLEALYTQIERTQLEQLYAVQRGGETTVADKVRDAIAVTLGLPGSLDPARLDESFVQLGGDSLNAVGLATLLEDLCGARVAVGSLLDPTRSIRALIEDVEASLAGEGRPSVTFEDVHGKGAEVVRAEDLRAEAFFGQGELDRARATLQSRPLAPRASQALLTGANGFLGRFLALELLERLEGERLAAIVRAPNDAAAFDRLARTYDTDPNLAARFQAAAADGRLTVLAGDLTKPRFGLSDEVYEQLSAEIDLVVHNGALVNHALGYAQMFEPNVLGTVEAIRLAFAQRPKSLAYVSTVAVLGGRGDGSGREDEDVRSLFTELPAESGYAAGYRATKWASELLLRDVHERTGLRVAVFRPSEIMAHRRYGGQVNVPDFFTRLLAGIVYTSLAPASFYDEETPPSERHFDGVPVDAVARAIVLASMHRESGGSSFETFHVVNAEHGEGRSLDAVVDWVRSAGVRVDRVADYGTWYRSFRDRLVALGEEERQHSPLAILGAWEEPQRPLLLDNSRLVERLRKISEKAAEIPHVSEAIVHKTLADMAMLGIIEPPPSLRKAS